MISLRGSGPPVRLAEVLSQALDDLEERAFDDWVRRRLEGWSAAEIGEFDRWLLDESHFEFVTSVRRAWLQRRLEEGVNRGSEEPAA